MSLQYCPFDRACGLPCDELFELRSRIKELEEKYRLVKKWCAGAEVKVSRLEQENQRLQAVAEAARTLRGETCQCDIADGAWADCDDCKDIEEELYNTCQALEARFSTPYTSTSGGSMTLESILRKFCTHPSEE